MLKRIVSFGFKNGAPPDEPRTLVIDVRKMFKNPYSREDLRPLTGLDERVQSFISSTPAFDVLCTSILFKLKVPGIEVAYIGCQGGKHRSPFIAELMGQKLGIPVEHRDLE